MFNSYVSHYQRVCTDVFLCATPVNLKADGCESKKPSEVADSCEAAEERAALQRRTLERVRWRRVGLEINPKS